MELEPVWFSGQLPSLLDFSDGYFENAHMSTTTVSTAKTTMSDWDWEYDSNLEPFECVTCGIVYAMKTTFIEQRKRTGKHFYCPNGHEMHYSQGKDLEGWEKEANALKEENQALRREKAKLSSQLDQLQAQRKSEENNES